ncbi:DUF4177 domain-containing protein [Ureibacillus aquaedulcis]|uniref:DUF4177 domain-containing protein n=1 Tax=Ureibacillus aquaedulcis TaxID=3058421 RepID=A0ABT8GVY5_9BACL|nr:DUF4177 domain-containing protein [Ureibacillus sp. BA0131]MDN4495529.1 DUF4177 domain-containing protein [Ureibacillus sp. BA0131]
MFEYKFETVSVSVLKGTIKDDHREIIKNLAKEGWRLHSFTPLPFLAGGQAQKIEIIFEKEIR